MGDSSRETPSGLLSREGAWGMSRGFRRYSVITVVLFAVAGVALTLAQSGVAASTGQDQASSANRASFTKTLVGYALASTLPRRTW